MTKLHEAKFLNVYTVENYEAAGEQRSAWHEVGRAWVKTNKAGAEYLSIRIHPGISVSGDLLVQAPRPREEEPGAPPKQTGDGGEKSKRYAPEGSRFRTPGSHK